MTLINKSDFGAYVKFSDNVPARDVDFQCKDAQIFDLEPISPLAKVSGNNLVTDIETAISESPVTKHELVAFFNDYVKPFLVCKAYSRLLVWHGRNITQFGLRVNQEDTSTEVSDKARGEMIADINHKANIYLARMEKELKDVNYTFDTVVYSFTNCETKPKAMTRFTQI